MDRILYKFFEHIIESSMILGDSFSDSIQVATEIVANALLTGNTIFTAGQGNSCALAQLLTHNLALGTQIDRPGFPSLNLSQMVCGFTTDCNAKVLLTHSKSSDILFLLSRGASNTNLIQFVEAGVQRDLRIILVAYKDDAMLIEHLRPRDLCLDLSRFESRVLSQLHLQIIESLSQLVDHVILGEN